jgi:transglutaminase-like putative cysteine protease
MMKIFYSLILLPILFGCSYEKPLISNPARINDIEKMLKVQKELTANSQIPIWSILEKASSKNEAQALKFLYAYMPLSDLADYSPEFMLANIRQSLLTRKEMAWGNTIPEDEFLHFVLPPRVNNENLDSFRLVYYDEIKARIAGLQMKDASLEINHWCHEKVNYRGTDSRTSAPMSTIRKGFGRCGEESTFTVAAMRTAGIPARQVYTPRWAHTDDNHAWVEVWLEGKWHFMGACEPDAALDRGWFSEPSQRTMLVHTRCYGRYFGSEEVLDAQDRFSELNLTANYATTKTVTVVVTRTNGQPAVGAKVEFKLYNYAEFYPLATIQTNRHGTATFTTGMGDLLVWASHDGLFSWKKLHVPATDTLRLMLESPTASLTENLTMVPPRADRPIAPVSDTERKINDSRLAAEDSIRNTYMSTFRDSAWIKEYAHTQQLATDTLMRILRLSYGNWRELTKYLEANKTQFRSMFLPLTYGISDKDLSDTKASILSDHLSTLLSPELVPDLTPEYYANYVLAPRIALEQLAPWRQFLQQKMGKEMATAAKADMTVLTRWIQKNIRTDQDANRHSRAPLTPIGVYNLRVADPHSVDIFFVAACRTFGIPARLNPETRIPEYWQSGKWYRDGIEEQKVVPELGQLILKDKGNLITPQYALHFSIASIREGSCRTLEFEEGKKLTDLPSPMMLETGQYLMVTGKRMADGTVLSTLTIFEIRKDQPTTLDVTLRNTATSLNVEGKLDLSAIRLKEISGERDIPLADLMGKSAAVLVLMDPDSEPSKHILHDLAPYVDQFSSWEGQMIFVNTIDKTGKYKVFQNYKLPAKTILAGDVNNDLAKSLTAISGKEAKLALPQVLFCLPSGELLMISPGYKIGMGEILLQLIKELQSDEAKQILKSCTTI